VEKGVGGANIGEKKRRNKKPTEGRRRGGLDNLDKYYKEDFPEACISETISQKKVREKKKTERRKE